MCCVSVLGCFTLTSLLQQMGRGLNKADIATRSYLLTAIFSLIKENREMTSAHRNTQQLLADLQIWLEVTFSLTAEQKVHNFFNLLLPLLTFCLIG